MESDELDILMEEWQEYERNRLGNEFKYFINDGFIDKKAWMNQTGVKICYFLKEAYHDENNDTPEHVLNWIRDCIKDKGPKGMWKKVSTWTQATKSAGL